MKRMRKMSKAMFSEKRGISESFWGRVLKNERNLGHDVAVRVARVLGTTKGIWRNDGWMIARVAAWEAYCEKFNGGGE